MTDIFIWGVWGLGLSLPDQVLVLFLLLRSFSLKAPVVMYPVLGLGGWIGLFCWGIGGSDCLPRKGKGPQVPVGSLCVGGEGHTVSSNIMVHLSPEPACLRKR